MANIVSFENTIISSSSSSSNSNDSSNVINSSNRVITFEDVGIVKYGVNLMALFAIIVLSSYYREEIKEGEEANNVWFFTVVEMILYLGLGLYFGYKLCDSCFTLLNGRENVGRLVRGGDEDDDDDAFGEDDGAFSLIRRMRRRDNNVNRHAVRLNPNMMRLLMTERDFTENDYEALLALDVTVPPNGATPEQIQRLPTHTIQHSRHSKHYNNSNNYDTTNNNNDNNNNISNISNATNVTTSNSNDNDNDNIITSAPSTATLTIDDNDDINDIDDIDDIEMKENLSCGICLEPMVVNEVVRTLPCLHQFHSQCIDKWLVLHPNCPVCKTNIFQF